MIRSFATRWLDAADRQSLAARLLVTWLLCLIPRVAFTLLMGPSQDYLHFQGAPLNSYWYPFYTWTARFLWALSGARLWIYVGLHLAIHSLIGPVVYLLARQLRFPRAVAWLSVVAAGYLPIYVSIAGRQANVGILIVLFAGLLVGFVRWIHADLSFLPGSLFAVLSFLILALRPNALSVIAYLYTLALLMAWRRRGVAAPGAPWRGVERVIVSGGIFLILVGGQSWNNLRATGHFTPFTPNNGYNLYVGNNPHVASYAKRYDIMSLESAVLDHGLPGDVLAEPDPYVQDRVLGRLAVRYILENPMQTFWNALLKTVRYWDFRMERAAKLPWLWNAALAIPYFVYGPLAVVGAWRMWRHGRRFALAVLGGSLISFWLPHVIYFGSIRMRMATEFLLLMLAAYALGSSPEDGAREAPG